jgi:DNA-binding transcriptional MerR regulator
MSAKQNKLTIGLLAKESKVNVETIRYYQNLRLIEKNK